MEKGGEPLNAATLWRPLSSVWTGPPTMTGVHILSTASKYVIGKQQSRPGFRLLLRLLEYNRESHLGLYKQYKPGWLDQQKGQGDKSPVCPD